MIHGVIGAYSSARDYIGLYWIIPSDYVKITIENPGKISIQNTYPSVN